MPTALASGSIGGWSFLSYRVVDVHAQPAACSYAESPWCGFLWGVDTVGVSLAVAVLSMVLAVCGAYIVRDYHLQKDN